jgi:hypothetical protein
MSPTLEKGSTLSLKQNSCHLYRTLSYTIFDYLRHHITLWMRKRYLPFLCLKEHWGKAFYICFDEKNFLICVSLFSK